MHKRYPYFDIYQKRKLSIDVELTPCDLLLAFLPLDLISERFNAWRQHEEAAGRAGLRNIDRPMFLRILATIIRRSLYGLRRRELPFRESECPALSQRTVENLLYTIRDCGMDPYDEGDQLPDGRSVGGDDPVKSMRRFMDQVQAHWQDIYKAGSIVVVDETTVGLTADRNVHITRLPNKPTERGVCLKTAADGLSKVMLSFELLECAADQAQKRHREEQLQ
jgi:hypothetical protein